MSPELSIAGLLVGLLVGATGMGGGSLMTPLLVLLFGFKPTVAIGTDILHGAVFKTVGAIRHRRLGTVQARLSGWMLLGSAPSSLAGVGLATWLKHVYGDGIETATGQILGAALIFGGIGVTAKVLFRDAVRPDVPFVLRRRDRIAAVLIGLVGGFVVGLTSVGSGVFFGLTMLILFPLRSAKVVGTDIFHAAALLWIAGVGHFAAGNVDLGATGWLLLGSVPGVLIGSRFTVAVPDRLLTCTMAAVLLLSGVKLAEVPATVAIPMLLGLAVLTVSYFTVRRRVTTGRWRKQAPQRAPSGLSPTTQPEP